MAQSACSGGPTQLVVLAARPHGRADKAISTPAGGFGPFCPWLRQKVWKYYHIPAPFFLATNKIASNLGRAINGS